MEIHLGFEVYPDCQCLLIGKDGTKSHSGPLRLIEVAQGISAGRRTRTCENHLNCYLPTWKIIADIEVSGANKGLVLSE